MGDAQGWQFGSIFGQQTPSQQGVDNLPEFVLGVILRHAVHRKLVVPPGSHPLGVGADHDVDHVCRPKELPGSDDRR